MKRVCYWSVLAMYFRDIRQFFLKSVNDAQTVLIIRTYFGNEVSDFWRACHLEPLSALKTLKYTTSRPNKKVRGVGM